MKELVKSPYTGLMCYQFNVKCRCFCHAPGYVNTAWMFAPCCNCDTNHEVLVELYPIELIERVDIKERFNNHNYLMVNTYPELLPLITIPDESAGT